MDTEDSAALEVSEDEVDAVVSTDAPTDVFVVSEDSDAPVEDEVDAVVLSDAPSVVSVVSDDFVEEIDDSVKIEDTVSDSVESVDMGEIEVPSDSVVSEIPAVLLNSSPLPSLTREVSSVISVFSPEPSTVVNGMSVEAISLDSLVYGESLNISSSVKRDKGAAVSLSNSIPSANLRSSLETKSSSSSSSQSSSSVSSVIGDVVLSTGISSSFVHALVLHFSERDSIFDSSQLSDLVPLDKHKTSRVRSPPPHGLLHGSQGPVNH